MRARLSGMAAIGLAVAVLIASPMRGAYGQEPPIYGSELMTEQERAEYRARVRTATSEEEREQIRLQHHAEMQKRAAERGIELPDPPPVTGMGQGMGQRSGNGRGSGGHDAPGRPERSRQLTGGLRRLVLNCASITAPSIRDYLDLRRWLATFPAGASTSRWRRALQPIVTEPNRPIPVHSA